MENNGTRKVEDAESVDSLSLAQCMLHQIALIEESAAEMRKRVIDLINTVGGNNK